ncbi:microbial collagenase [Streptomyces sp. 1114.5]|uniref:M9 family metallopeptidase n=1 Tax=Streptomyces sp. 1114.5 TaxID=1938830 RepID=UPI000F29E773|nr:M9 family metallopeptidase [Streptomyces sp. 1114.5]RKT18728.1 microbial collagenase [Streptomyces sp. 1114.5]
MSPARLLRLLQPARLLTLLLSLFLAVGLFAPQSQAAPVAAPAATPGGAPTTPAGPAPQPATGTPQRGDGERQFTSLDQRAPLPLDTRPAEARPAAQPRNLATAAQQACTISDFTGRTGSDLVQHIKAADVQCINSLFPLTGSDARGAFREEQMTTVAYALRDAAGSYPGDDSTSVEQLVLYLRAGYFVQWYHKDDVGTYGTALQTAIRSGLDAFFGSAHSRDVTAGNATILGESVTLIDSAQENVRYLPVVKRLLTDYDSASWNPAGMAWAVNPVFTVLFRGHQVDGFDAAVEADPSVLDTLSAFAGRTGDLLGGDFGVLPYNATKELGRFLKDAALQAKVRPLAKALAAQSAPSGRTVFQWAAVAESVGYYDAANCSYYGTCNAADQLKSGVLTIRYTCSPSIKLIAQALDGTQLATTCASLTGQDAFVHAVVKDNGPVKDDGNTTIEVVVFHSSLDYQVLAAAIYGIDTNNGGMYLEGNPAAAGNQPRFLCYEAEWVRPSFQIWNLNHEYTHYLDGRFDMYGDFDAGMTTPTVWWVEGFAEYVSYSYRKVTNDAAVAAAARHTYKLSDLFDTVYGDQDRVYRWGYLAVRYMLEQHRPDVDALLAKYRVGDWAGARTLLKTTIGTRYDAGFDSWLTSCANGACATTPTVPTAPECTAADTRQLGAGCARSNVAATTGNYAHFYLLVPAGTKQVKITTGGGTGNGDLYYNASNWAYTGAYTARSTGPDNSETLTVTNPPAGYVYFSLYAQQGFSGVTVTSEM